MSFDINNHPCFNDKVRHTHGRVHLPVAPECNIQCNFCNRKYDCVNESRPGVTSSVLSPEHALDYLEKIISRSKKLSVVGIAGPGDPFASPELTMETLRFVRKKYPDRILCIATNGLNLAPYVEKLSTLNTSHVTITVNAVDQEIGSRIYSWVRYNKRVYRKTEGARILLEKQLDAIRLLKEKGITVKINTIIIPGINDHHVVEVARKMSELGADIINCVPLYRNEGSVFGDIDEPDAAEVAKIRGEAGKYIPQMHHCTRCRADAAGLLGADMNASEVQSLMKSSVALAGRPNIAVASLEGVLVNMHLGEADEFMIFTKDGPRAELLEKRKAPPAGGGISRWENLADILEDCSHILVNGVGSNPQTVLEEKGIRVLSIEGLIDDAVETIFRGNSVNQFLVRKKFACGTECSGSGGGCG